jgi:NAD-specific glutamate dehydrogenase
MPCRKRRQGQQRRLKKYISSQTGGHTNPEFLLQRDNELLHKIEEMNTQIEDHRQTLSQMDIQKEDGNHTTTKSVGNPVGDEKQQETELHEQQKKHLSFLLGMRDDMVETLHVNRRIYSALQCMNDCESFANG